MTLPIILIMPFLVMMFVIFSLIVLAFSVFLLKLVAAFPEFFVGLICLMAVVGSIMIVVQNL